MANPLAPFLAWLKGEYVQPPSGGARDIAPGNPPVQTGNYQFIQSFFFDNAGSGNSTTEIPDVPPAYQDWNQFPVNLYGLSGLTGGGITGDVPDPYTSQGASLFFDPSTGLYYDVRDVNNVMQLPETNAGAY